MAGALDHQPHGYCSLCDGPCDSKIEKPHAKYPFVHPDDRAPTTAPDGDQPPRSGRRRGRRARKPTEDRMRRPEEDR